jgi:hypothetical protein
MAALAVTEQQYQPLWAVELMVAEVVVLVTPLVLVAQAVLVVAVLAHST